MERNFDHIFSELFLLLGKRISQNEYLAYHTTFKVGGPASLFLTVENRYELSEVLRILRVQSCPLFILGGGSNLLVSDKGFSGAVIKLTEGFSYSRREDSYLIAGAATRLTECTKVAQGAGLKGLAFAAGIPGTIGGAAAVNAGAFGYSMGDFLERATLLSPESGKEVIANKEDFGFSYRSTAIKGKAVVLEAVLKLEEDSPQNILKQMRDFLAQRRKAQPLGFNTAGSIFKNPPGEYAGKLIEDIGCKGLAVGDAVVSDIHANFIVNRGKASSQDIYNLVRIVQERVQEKVGVSLELEIIMVGDFK